MFSAKQIRIALIIRQACRAMGIKVASVNVDWVNVVARANLLEGAMGLKKDSLSRGSGSARMIEKKLAEYGSQLASVDPELKDFRNTRKGPVTTGAVAMLEKMMDSVSGNYQGIDAMGYVVGLWDPSMMPGADGGFARTNADPFWYSLGRKQSAKILAGSFGIRDAINLTSKQLKNMGLNYINLASRRTEDTSHEYDTYENTESMDSGTVGSEYFRALNNPSHRWHNRAKEFWQDAIKGRMGPNVSAVVEAFLELGATERGGIKGGYGAAQAWINERAAYLGLEREISAKGVKKAWEKVKEQFGAKFQAGMNDAQWSDLWIGLADEMDINATFSRNDGMQIVYQDSRMASVVNRHAYRQTLRNRKQA